jgi:hypothetical protein
MPIQLGPYIEVVVPLSKLEATEVRVAHKIDGTRVASIEVRVIGDANRNGEPT